MNFVIGIVIAVGSIIGGYSALGGHLEVLVQPFEFLIICGASLGVFIVSNPFATIKDCGKGFIEAVTDKVPKPRDFLDVLSVLHALMRELRAKSRSEVEAHFDNPKESEIFKAFPKLLDQRRAGHLHLRLLPPHHHRQRQDPRDRSADGRGDRNAHLRQSQACAGLAADRRRAAGARHRRGGARRHSRHGLARSIAGNPRRSGRRGAGRDIRRHLPVLRRDQSDRRQDQRPCATSNCVSTPSSNRACSPS